MSTSAIKIKGGKDGLWVILDRMASFPMIELELNEKLEKNANYFPRGITINIVAKGFGFKSRKRLRELFSERDITIHFAEAEPAKIIARKKAASYLRQKIHSVGEVPQLPVIFQQNSFQSFNVQAEANTWQDNTYPEETFYQQPDAQMDEQTLEQVNEYMQFEKEEPVINNIKAEMKIIDRTVRGGEKFVSEGSILIFGNVHAGAHIEAGGNIDIRGTCNGVVHAGVYGDTSAIIVADRMQAMQIRIADNIICAPDAIEYTGKPEKAYIKDGKIIVEAVIRSTTLN